LSPERFKNFGGIKLIDRVAGATMTDDPAMDFSMGEKQSPRWTYQFVDLTRIEAGEHIVPAKIDSQAGREYAALQSVLEDLSFALECLREADKLGLPDSENIHSKALIFSAVVAYARPFKTSVREIRLDPAYFSAARQGFNLDLHNYLIAVRDKHVAHSVNEFEQCAATGVMVGTPETKWRAAGVGFTRHSIIGLSRSIVEQAVAQVSNMIAILNSNIEQSRFALYEEFRAKFEQDGKWEMAPLATFPSRENVPKRRT
jgi:hypothetical protein